MLRSGSIQSTGNLGFDFRFFPLRGLLRA